MGWKINVTNNKFFKTFSSKKLEILPPSGCPPLVNCISTYFPWKRNRLKTILEPSKLYSFGNYHILLNLTGYNKSYYKTKNTVFPLHFKSNGVLTQLLSCMCTASIQLNTAAFINFSWFEYNVYLRAAFIQGQHQLKIKFISCKQ